MKDINSEKSTGDAERFNKKIKYAAPTPNKLISHRYNIEEVRSNGSKVTHGTLLEREI
jgi:hypothetical protein